MANSFKPGPGGKVRFTRYSPNGMNGVRQHKVGGGHFSAPERHGLWVFLAGHEDLYFCWSAIQSRMPKPDNRAYGNTGGWTDEDERLEDEAIAKAKRSLFRVIEWAGPVYSCINPRGKVTRDPDFGGEWNYYDRASDFLRAARRCYVGMLAHAQSGNIPYGDDHFECFLPGKKF